ncbi:MAG: sulfotransferase [Chloroflexota bacterium]
MISDTNGIIVLGAERSGTSVITDMIHRWGAYAGKPSQLTGPNEHNPQGQWEYEPLWDVLAEVGDFAQGETWWDPAFETRITAKLDDAAIRTKAQALLADMKKAGRPWVWKDPALCHFLPFWQPLWGDVAYVIMVRHPYDIARSWQQYTMPVDLRDKLDLTRCNLLRWQHIIQMVLCHTNHVASKIFIEYETLIRYPVSQALRLAQFLDTHCGCDPADEQRIDDMTSRVMPAFWRNRSKRMFPEVSEATPAQQRLYAFLQRKVDEPSLSFVDEYPMPMDWCEFVINEEKRRSAIVKTE